jgi:predicted dehydrogenase
VFLEKPIARTLDEADEIINACRDAERKLMIGYILRFDPAYAAIRQGILDGKLGTFKVAYARRNGTIHEARRLGGRTSVTNYIAVHDIDQILSYNPGARVTSVVAKAVRGRVQQELGTWDFSWGMFEFEDGGLGVVETGWGLPEASWGDSKMQVIGTAGQYALDFVPMNLMAATEDGWSFPTTRLWTDVEGRLTGAVQSEIAHFVECLGTDRAPCVSGDDGRRSLEVALAIERSIESGKEIDLPLQ